MDKQQKRRAFLKTLTLGSLGAAAPIQLIRAEETKPDDRINNGTPDPDQKNKRKYNGIYQGSYLNRLAFPIGGLGAGMFCLEGTGAISHMSVRNKPEVFNEPAMFAAITVKGLKNGAKLLEGQVPEWKFFGRPGSGNGLAGSTLGLPRFKTAACTCRFPYCSIDLQDQELPLHVRITGWSPFIPTDEDNSGLPAGALEYHFTNTGKKKLDAVFSYNSKNFLADEDSAQNAIEKIGNGFVLTQQGTKDKPYVQGAFAIFTDDDHTVVDHCWFRGGWWDPLTMAWNNIRDARVQAVEPVEKGAGGASLFIPFSLMPGSSKTIRLMMVWYVPESNLQIGTPVPEEKKNCDPESGCCAGPADLGVTNGKESASPNYKPWYCSRFNDIREVAEYWKNNYDELNRKSTLFKDAFFSSTLPPEVQEAVAANLTILKSPTVLRQYDGRLWSWEGCGDDGGCCHGSCTHVWNYAQAIPHLFPSLERTLRNTEFCENQNHVGHQGFRANMPISPLKHDFYAAADGQLGGIMKVYRDWRISGDNHWLRRIYPMVCVSMDYGISTWDPREKGVVEEPHHNTYDIEFWGAEGMCTSFYLGALTAIIAMGNYLKKDVERYRELYAKGKAYLETRLYNGEYFFQEIEYKNLNAADPSTAQSFGGEYSAEAREILKKEGPKYQYGTGCLSDGVLGAWIGSMCGLDPFIDQQKISSHLISVHKYNFKKNLIDHANPQRPDYALGNEAGLLLCTWPKGGKLSLPFVYSDEVWTGIEYQVASHLLLTGHTQAGLDIVRACRDRYDGRIRNPFNEYECGHWYARAMSSYGLLQAFTGVRYDAVDKILYADSRMGDFTSFISTATGFGTVRASNGKLSLRVAYGTIPTEKIILNGKETRV
ncbi:MAG: GH116 family glycosyl hydrolase [Bacteroidota bacterium]|nr:GH116 family glycosyl hydrolase [Bacteroidota bacterium]